jgi:hypothetical protein
MYNVEHFWLQTGELGFDSQQGPRVFLLDLSVQTSTEFHSSYTVGNAGPFHRGETCLGHDADHLPPSSAKVKN